MLANNGHGWDILLDLGLDGVASRAQIEIEGLGSLDVDLAALLDLG